MSLFAIAVSSCEFICPRRELISARTSKQTRARALVCRRALLAHAVFVARAPRACTFFARARACAHVLKCSRARAAHPAAVEAPHMNSYVLNEAKIDWGVPTLRTLFNGGAHILSK